MSEVRIGTSGWHYTHWRGVFYPDDLPTRAWLAYYARHFDTVEINNTFYQLPEPGTFSTWAEIAPPNFLFAVKGSRYITHMKKLRDCGEPLERFLERSRLLGEHLGPILWQLPPRWHCNPDRLASFLRLLPTDLRHAFEFRDPSWFTDDIYALLREHGAALCIYNMGGSTSPWMVTADWTYLRFHGPEAKYAGRYTEDQVEECAWKIRESVFDKGLSVYAYFNNDAHGWAIENARYLAETLHS